MMTQKLLGRLIGGGVCLVNIQDITAIQSNIHEQKIYLRDGKEVGIRQTLISLKEELDKNAPGQFIDCSKGVLINALAVSFIYADHVVVTSGQSFPLAQRNYRKFQQKITSYLGVE